jgi:hypothetical protein
LDHKMYNLNFIEPTRPACLRWRRDLRFG